MENEIYRYEDFSVNAETVPGSSLTTSLKSSHRQNEIVTKNIQ